MSHKHSHYHPSRSSTYNPIQSNSPTPTTSTFDPANILALTSILPPKEEYTVVANSSGNIYNNINTINNNNNTNNNSNSSSGNNNPLTCSDSLINLSSQFAGVRVSRGTLAVFGDDTAKQFALHVDKLLKERSNNNSVSSVGNAGGGGGSGLLVRGGDIGPRAAFLKNDSVKVFEDNVSVLLNASLRQREIRQRDKDTASHKVDDKKNNNEEKVAVSSSSSSDDDDDGSDDNSESGSPSD